MIPVLIYAGVLIAANLLAATFGPVITPVVGFLMIGLDLTLRDRLHDQWHGQALWPRMAALILTASAVSYMLNPATKQIAIASAISFGVASLVDAVVYELLRRKTWATRANGSNLAASAVDSVIFPLIAFGAFMPGIVVLQFAAKLAGGAVWAALLGHKRAAA